MLLKSSTQTSLACSTLLELVISRECLGRLSEKVWPERVEQCRCKVTAARKLTLMERCSGPVGITLPIACAVWTDGGRLQLTDKDDPAPAASDPCPHVPEFLLNFEQVETLTMELAHRAAMPVSETTFDEDAPSLTLDELAEEVGISDLLAAAEKASAEQRRAIRDLPLSPRIKRREVVATLDKATEFGELLFATAGPQGFFQAPRNGFVADGGIWL